MSAGHDTDLPSHLFSENGRSLVRSVEENEFQVLNPREPVSKLICYPHKNKAHIQEKVGRKRSPFLLRSRIQRPLNTHF